MLKWTAIVVLSVALIGTGIWGYQVNQEKEAILVHAENNYQRAFHDLTYRIDLLHDKISTVMATNTPERLSPQMADIWKITSEAHADVGQLPLSILPFNQTAEFLTNINRFSYGIAIRELEDEPLDDNEMDYLTELYEQADEVRRDLRTVQHQVLNDGLRWMDVEMALANNEPSDNKIIDGFQTIETNAVSYLEVGDKFGVSGKDPHREISFDGEDIDEQEAASIFREQFELNDSVDIDINESLEGSTLPLYSALFENDGYRGYGDITKEGGNVISFILNRELEESQISLHEGMNQAEELLNSLGYDDMEPIESSQYEKTGVYTFVRVEDDIYYHLDRIQVKVALDNGEIIGLTARDYLVNTALREDVDFRDELSEEEALELVNPALDVQETRLAVIENDVGEEVLAYEFIGHANDSTYRVFINAQDGFEESVERLHNSEELYS